MAKEDVGALNEWDLYVEDYQRLCLPLSTKEDVGTLNECKFYVRGLVRHIFTFKIHFFKMNFLRNGTKPVITRIIQIRLT